MTIKRLPADGSPATGWRPLVTELLVEDLDASLGFWVGVLGFAIAYERPAEQFVFLERSDGAQIMLSNRALQHGRNETGPCERPFGRGVMHQLSVDALDDVVDAANRLGATVHEPVHEEWRQIGDVRRGRREIKLLDPDGYLVMVAEDLTVSADA